MHVGSSKGARDVRNARCTSSDLREGRFRSCRRFLRFVKKRQNDANALRSRRSILPALLVRACYRLGSRFRRRPLPRRRSRDDASRRNRPLPDGGPETVGNVSRATVVRLRP